MLSRFSLNRFASCKNNFRKLCKPFSSVETKTTVPSSGEVDEVVESCKEHTFWTWSAQKQVNPIHMARAEGIYFWDANGKRYTDMNSQLMCTNVGHQHPKMIQAIKDQAEELCFAGPMFATRVRAELGPLLANRTPGDLNKFFFTLGGSEANENAIKLAKMHTNRTKVIARYRSYHGATHGSAMLTGDPRRWPHENSGMGGIVRVFDPYKYRSPLYQEGMTDEEYSTIMVNQLEETIIYENPENIAAMLLETITGTNGIIPPPEGYLKGVRRVLSKYGIMMICDEVMCGLGRTGEWFAVDNWEVIPDMITMAKGLTSGFLPLGAIAMSPEIAASFDNRVFSGGLTYSCHPMCLAAAVATMKILEEENLVENAKDMGIVMRRHLETLKRRHPSIGEIRSVGLFACVELVKNTKTREPLAPFNGSHPAITKMMAHLKEKGIYNFAHWNMVHFIPPLIINEQQLEETFAVVDEAFKIVDQEVDQRQWF